MTSSFQNNKMQSLPDPLIYEVLCYLKVDELWRVMKSGLDRGKWLKDEEQDECTFTFGDFLFVNESKNDWGVYTWSVKSNSSQIKVMWKTGWAESTYVVMRPINRDVCVCGPYPGCYYSEEEKREIERLIRYL